MVSEDIPVTAETVETSAKENQPEISETQPTPDVPAGQVAEKMPVTPATGHGGPNPPFAPQQVQKNRIHLPTVLLSAALSLVIAFGSSTAAVLLVKKQAPAAASSSETSQAGSSEQSPVNITVDKTSMSAVEAVAAKVTPSVVGIRTTAAVQSFFGGSEKSTGEGSGIIYSTDGYIITNYHVIESATQTANSKIEVFLASDTSTAIDATVVGYNISYDLAVIKIDRTGLPAVEIGDSSKLAVGQYVVAIGNPGGLEYMGSVSSGIISGLNRTILSSSGSSSAGTSVSLIQTDAAINPGNSGGALIDIEGKLIGVNSSKIVSESYEGMGFSIPVNTVVEICNKIIAKESNPDPYIGITLSETWNATRLKQYGYPAGAVVKSVVDGGPAYTGGIRSGDIITEFSGTAVESSEQLSSLVSSCKPGETVSLKLYRAGKYYSTSVEIGSNNSQ